jgi:hypothetical protein
MKHYLILFYFVICSISVYSQETYVCSAELTDFGSPGEYEKKTYERIEGYFLKTSNAGTKSVFIIADETESFITLVNSTKRYPSVFLTFIDKKNGTFYEQYINPDTPIGQPLKGEYIIKN